MPKYVGLRDHLRESTEDRVTLPFAEMESIIRAPLRESARQHQEWWANGEHSHASSWLDAFFIVDRVDLGGSVVSFARSGPSTSDQPARAASSAGSPRRRRTQSRRAHRLHQLRGAGLRNRPSAAYPARISF